MSENRELQVGDVLYIEDRYGGIKNKIIIDRVTKTQAVSGRIKLRRRANSFGDYEAIGKHRWVYNFFWLENEEKKSRYRRQEMERKFSDIESADLTDEQLAAILIIALKKGDNQ